MVSAYGPVPPSWMRDAPPRTLAQRFTETCMPPGADYPRADDVTARAWQLVLDAWRVIEVASARGDVPARCNREEWMAALRVAIFRADHPDAPEVMPDGS